MIRSLVRMVLLLSATFVMFEIAYWFIFTVDRLLRVYNF